MDEAPTKDEGKDEAREVLILRAEGSPLSRLVHV